VSRLYDAADSIIAQKIAQVSGVGQVSVNGGARPAVRVDVNPTVLASHGLSLEAVRTAISQFNSNEPKGSVSNGVTRWVFSANDQIFDENEYRSLIIAFRNGAPIRLGDIANVQSSVENVYNAGLLDGKPAIIMAVNRQPGANIVGTVDKVIAMLPSVRASIPAAMTLMVEHDRTQTIRASVHDIQITLLITVVLVILVIFAFLRSVRATLIPAVAVPVSLVGTFGVMYLLGYSIDNLSLMALTIVTGFVVDDAIVVIENITRYLEAGMKPYEAALKGSQEIGFTVLSMSTSLISVFIPILMMGGIVGRLFREFAVVLSVAVAMSLVVSLTVTPMMCATLLKPAHKERHNWIYRASERGFNAMLAAYDRGMHWVLKHQRITLAANIATVCLSILLYYYIPKGFFPQQDIGGLQGSIVGPQDTSFDVMAKKQKEYCEIVMADPAVASVTSFVGGSAMNSGRLIIHLKPLSQRNVSADQVIGRLRRKLATVPGGNLFLQAQQDINVGARQSNSQFQFTIESEDLSELNHWGPVMLAKMKTLPELRDVSTDQQVQGLEANLVIDRDTASRMGIPAATIDSTLYDAFGQRLVSTLFAPMNEYHVVMDVASVFQQNPDALKSIYVSSSTGMQVPLSTFTHFEPKTTSLSVNHQGQFPAITLSFNLAPNVALGDAVTAVEVAARDVGMPASVQASFQGAAQAFQSSLKNEPILIAAAIAAVYIVLGMLYESYIHPITILSTLPSAGVGALVALMIWHTDLTVIALIGIILLIGIVKKNAIMMVDFAIDCERKRDMSPEEAIYQACMLRFRPIMMTTMAALFGGLPLALGNGTGSELRRPLGIAIVGGLLVSQVLTLFTTPVVYLYMDRLRLFLKGPKRLPVRRSVDLQPSAPPSAPLGLKAPL
jgi:hydrophobe/amphiphile efflux-1 (HAE1) family protein